MLSLMSSGRARILAASLLALTIALPATAENSAITTAPELGAWGVDLTIMDEEVKPGDDFFRYVNGAWLERFEIPAEFSNYGSFTVLFERSEERVGQIIEDAANANPPADSLRGKIANYYKAYLDTDEIEKRGTKAIKSDLAYFDGLKSHADVAAAMMAPGRATNGPIGTYINVDSKQPDRYAVFITQAGLGMPTRDYYLEERFADERTAYMALINRMLKLAKVKTKKDTAKRIMALETAMAKIHWEPAKQRNRDLTYNPRTHDELKSSMPGFPWDVAVEAGGFGIQDKYVVDELSAIEDLAELFRETPVALWKDYMKFHYLLAYSNVLPKAFDDASFEFYGKALQGQEVQRERHKRAIGGVNGALGEAVGKLYSEQYFPPEAKAAMDDLISNVIAAYDERIAELDWMSDETKRQAKEKLSKFKPFIGGPRIWRDYADLEVDPKDALGNVKRAQLSSSRYIIARLGKPVDPENEWGMTPQTVNAYYSSSRNAIYFPAAILQPPFFDPEADPAVNYGGIGAVIGHEIGHGFDDQGRKSDGDGALRDWWTEADAERFEEKTSALGAQYAQYSPVEGMTVNPELTMGENVGDLGGVAVAYHAYRKSLGGKEAPVIDGYTGDQRFFLSYGQIWQRKYREENLRWRLTADPHSPAEYRVNGVVRNMDAWYDAFDVKPGDALYLPPGERVHIW